MKIIMATGGTGGHLFPALKVAGELKNHGHEIVFIGSFRRGIEKIKEGGFAVHDLFARGVNVKDPKKFFLSVVVMLRALLRSHKILNALKPDYVVGFGGYGAFPVVLSSFFLKVPRLIHEQNVIPGRANRLLANICGKIAVSFKESKPYFPPEKTVLTGCPVQAEIKEFTDEEKGKIRGSLGLKEDKKTILVFGGSQGSQRINQVFFGTLAGLKQRIDLQVIHLCGDQDHDILKKKYLDSGIPYALFKFYDAMERLYGISDLVIARSGAVTVTEIALWRVNAILIPYPGAQGHQKYNALVLSKAGLAKLIEEKDLSVEKLESAVIASLRSPAKEKTLSSIEGIFPDARKRLASVIMGESR